MSPEADLPGGSPEGSEGDAGADARGRWRFHRVAVAENAALSPEKCVMTMLAVPLAVVLTYYPSLALSAIVLSEDSWVTWVIPAVVFTVWVLLMRSAWDTLVVVGSLAAALVWFPWGFPLLAAVPITAVAAAGRVARELRHRRDRVREALRELRELAIADDDAQDRERRQRSSVTGVFRSPIPGNGWAAWRMQWEDGRVTLAASWEFDGCYVETPDGEILRIEPNEVVLPFEMDHLFDGTRRVDAEMEIRVRAGTPVQMMGVVRRADYREASPASASGGSEATGTISGRVSVEMGASLR